MLQEPPRPVIGIFGLCAGYADSDAEYRRKLRRTVRIEIAITLFGAACLFAGFGILALTYLRAVYA